MKLRDASPEKDRSPRVVAPITSTLQNEPNLTGWKGWFLTPQGSLTMLATATIIAVLGFEYFSPGPNGGPKLWQMTTSWPAYCLGIVLITSALISASIQLGLPRKTLTWAIVFVSILVVLSGASHDGFLPGEMFGFVWPAHTEGLLHGRLDLPATGPFNDIPLYEGRHYLSYPIGAAIFPLLFGPYVKAGFIAIVLLTTMIFVRLSRSVHGNGVRDFDVFLLVGVILTVLVLNGSTFYPAAFVGATLFLGLGFLAIAGYERTGGIKMFAIGTACLAAGSLFRGELALVIPIAFLPAAARLRFSPAAILKCRELWLAAIFTTFSFGCLFTQNYLKFDDPFESGVMWNPVVAKPPNFKPQGLQHLSERFRNFFIERPSMDCGFAPHTCLFFRKQGSEPGGYVFWRYPFLFIGICSLPFLIVRWIRRRRTAVLLPWTNASIIMAGATMGGLFLLNFNTSPRYHSLFAPLLAASTAFYYFEQREMRVLTHVFALLMNISVLFSLYYLQGAQF